MSEKRADLERRRAADAESRRLAQQEFARPVAIEAGAGTGKTATLVARVLAWCLGPGWERARSEVLEASADPEEDVEWIAERVLRGVVAITFTEAAAAEMETRIDAALAALGRGEPFCGFDGAAAPERVAALRGALDQLVVQTIHAYCRRLLAAFPLEAGLHPRFEIDADGAARADAVREAVAEGLGAAYARGDAGVLDLAEHGVGPRELEAELVAQLAAGVTASDLARDPLAPLRIEALRARLAGAHQALEEASAGRLASVTRGDKARAVAASLTSARSCLEEPVHDGMALARLRTLVLDAWPTSARNALASWGQGRFSGAEADAFAERCSAIEGAARRVQRLLAHLESVDPEQLARLAPVLAALGADSEERLRRRGWIGFEGLLERSVALLARHPDVAARVRRAIDQLLVDELQDTDPRQCAIIAELALAGAPGDRPGLFLVGDPKQSIYGWRNADLAAYEALQQRVRDAGGVVGSLCVNHRSVPSILREVERVVAPVMERSAGLQPAFEALAPGAELEGEAGFAEGGRAPVEFWISAEADASGGLCATRAAEAAALEARALARDLRELHDLHGVRWRDVGVLFRSRGEWDVYLGALREAAVPFSVEGDRTYYRRREIVDAAALVCCILDPNDLVALVTLLRSSVAGVPDAAWIPLWEGQLPALAGRLGEAPDALAELRALLDAVAAGLDETLPGIDRISGWNAAAFACLESIAALRRSFESDPGDVFVERLRAALCFEATEAARFLGAWRAANLERFFTDLASALASGEPAASLLRRLRTAVAEEETPSAEPAASESVDAVRVLTLHGAKGLDWEHVYLMQLHKGEARGPTPGEVGRVGGELEALWCNSPTLARDLVAEHRAQVADAERVRTLYVGMTRARRRLVLCGLWPAWQERGSGASHVALLAQRDPPPPDLDALARTARNAGGRAVAAGACWVFPALQPRATEKLLAEVADPEVPDRADALVIAHPLPGCDARMALRNGVSVTELVAGAEAASDTPHGEDGGALGRCVGTALHAALERLDLAADPQAEWQRQRGQIAAQLRELAPRAGCERAIEDALACWDALGAGPLAARLRVLAGRIVARELPLLLPPAPGEQAHEGRAQRGEAERRSDGIAVGFVSGAIDLLYRDDDGRLVVVDYKTDRLAPGPDAAARRERHARQGDLYCRAVRQALGAEPAPRFEIWWLRSGRVERVLDASRPARSEAKPSEDRTG